MNDSYTHGCWYLKMVLHGIGVHPVDKIAWHCRSAFKSMYMFRTHSVMVAPKGAAG